VRQFFTLRYWATLLALGGLALAVMVLTSGSDDATPTDVTVVDGTELNLLHVDLMTPVFGVQAPQGLTIVDGRLVADIALLIDGTRTMVIKAGTRGEMNCPNYTALAQCVVAADLLGDAVLRFDLVPGTPDATIKLPAVMELLDNSMVRLANGWVVKRAFRVERVCDDETTSLKQFIEAYGDTATSTFNFETQTLVRVTCPRATATTTTLLPTPTVTGGTTVDTTPGTTAEPG
jgi:hypothetical protein